MASDSICVDGSLVEGLLKDKGVLPALLSAICRAAMEQEVSRRVGAGLHERSGSRVGGRNGYKTRRRKTRAGEVELDVPQVRGCEPYHPSLFGRWQRSERALLVACGEMYFQGVSTRNVREVLEAMCGGDVSATTVSQVARELDEKLGQFRTRRLDEHEYPYVKVDARYEKVRVDGRVVSQAVLVTMGYTEQGRREVLDYRLGDSESERTSADAFIDLTYRGLKGVRLLVSDAHAGIVAAARRHLQGVAWQRCRVHFMRELARKVSYKNAKGLLAEARAVFAGATREECLLRAEEMALRWEAKNAGVSRLLREGSEDCLAVLGFPDDHRRRLASTNELENLMKRLKKRTRVAGVFPGRQGRDRLIGRHVLEVHEQWLTEPVARFNMELAAPVPATA